MFFSTPLSNGLVINGGITILLEFHYGLFDTSFIIAYREEDIQRSDINIQLCLACIEYHTRGNGFFRVSLE